MRVGLSQIRAAADQAELLLAALVSVAYHVVRESALASGSLVGKQR
jgi:hypothetical protein